MLAIGVLLEGCGHSPAATQQEEAAVKAAVKPAATVPLAREADDVARYLAGLPGMPGSPFAELETSEAWQTHRKLLDEAWRKAEGSLLGRLKAFQQQELGEPVWEAPVFYPFGGPDALTIALLFPKSPYFTIVALEPPGTLPTLAQLKEADAEKYLAGTRETSASVLGKSFFVTKEMDRQFRGQITDGLLLPILQLLVRTHHKVLGFRYIRLDEAGNIIDRAADYKAPTKYGNKGIEIEFETESDSSIHTLDYFSINLADDHMAENPPFLSYLAQHRGVTTYLKATSYLTHHKEFSMIRDGILAGSDRILQDDSGIPFASFRPDVWIVQLYGDYTKPYGSFSWLEQPDLRAAYHQPGVKPLSLRLGYGYSRIASNLQLATRLPAE
jgi:hypothetical protein